MRLKGDRWREARLAYIATSWELLCISICEDGPIEAENLFSNNQLRNLGTKFF